MDSITKTLFDLKTYLLNINPSPAPGPVGFYVYPDEVANFKYLPVIVIQEESGQENAWANETYGSSKREFNAIVDCFLYDGLIDNDKKLRAAGDKHRNWAIAMNALFDTSTQLASGATLGRGGVRFWDMATHIEWWTKVRWGVRFKIPINLEFSN